jgi:uncharacterized protein YehS (DUF1456 family)
MIEKVSTLQQFSISTPDLSVLVKPNQSRENIHTCVAHLERRGKENKIPNTNIQE